MRTILFLILFLCSSLGLSQQGGTFNYLKLLPTSLPSYCSVGDLRTNSGTNNITFCTASNTWTSIVPPSSIVTSVGLSMPGIFSVSGSPVTSSGNLTVNLATESANTVWAGPSSGSAAAPTFRALVGADLPAPSATTFGGVKSLASTSHQWINSLSTSGVLASSQPSCSDLSNGVASCSTDTTNASNISSGTLGAARLPNPSTSTLGGVEAVTAVSHQWVNSISTSGVPALSQPAFTDISGTISSGQVPTLNQNTTGTAANITGVAALANGGTNNGSLAATAGGVLYTDGTKVVNVGAGTSGWVLQSNGSSAPSWVAAAAGTSPTNNYWSGYMGNTSLWSTTSATFVTPTNTGGNILTQRNGSGITVTAASSNAPGITFTPASSSAVYWVKVTSGARVLVAANSISVRLTDGTNIVGDTGYQVTSGGAEVVGWPFTIEGTYVPGTSSAVTLSLLLGSGTSGQTVSIAAWPALTASSIEWSIFQIK